MFPPERNHNTLAAYEWEGYVVSRARPRELALELMTSIYKAHSLDLSSDLSWPPNSLALYQYHFMKIKILFSTQADVF